MKNLKDGAISLLIDLIKIPSFSTKESKTADRIADFLSTQDIEYQRITNNIVSRNRTFSIDKKNIILNSHHDTVKVVGGWSRDPFGAEIDGNILYGLGSNDAGASIVSLITTYVHFYEKELPYNLVLIASAEEEIFGGNGMASILENLDFKPDLGIIGEPTEMKMAVAEKGLLVIDCSAKGTSGHVAHQKGDNAIYKAMKDVEWLSTFEFPKVSEMLGKVSISVTQIEAGYQHNVVPDICKFVVDVRVNECYSLKEIFQTIEQNCISKLQPRNFERNPSKIDLEHPLVKRGLSMGLPYYGSSTLSDQVHFKCPTLKIGPGDSLRSHTADEFIRLSEVRDGIDVYIALLEGLSL